MLDERKAAILSAVVREYIETAQPVGSGRIAAAPGVVYGESTLRLDAGDQLLLYTAGVTEARAPNS